MFQVKGIELFLFHSVIQIDSGIIADKLVMA
jgi:hypothetical protein